MCISIMKINDKDILYTVEYSLYSTYYITRDYRVYEVYYGIRNRVKIIKYPFYWRIDDIEKLFRGSSNVYMYDV